MNLRINPLVLILELGILFSLTPLFAQNEESLSITTYYPSAYGVYREIRLFPMDLNSSPACDAIHEGSLRYFNTPSTNLYGCFYDQAAGVFDWKPFTGGEYWDRFEAAGAAHIYNLNSGNVGIGTAQPRAKLHVDAGGAGDVLVAHFRYECVGGNYCEGMTLGVLNPAVRTSIYPSYDVSSWSDHLFIGGVYFGRKSLDYAGSYLVGVCAGWPCRFRAALQLGQHGFLVLSNGVPQADGVIGYIRDVQTENVASPVEVTRIEGRTDATPDSGQLVFYTNPGAGSPIREAMRIKSSGYVGIGTNNPQEMLDVQGTLSIKYLITGGSGIKQLYVNQGGSLHGQPSSDLRLKKDISSLSSRVNVLEALDKMRAVYFRWDTSKEKVKGLDNNMHIGMIAQEVEPELPELVNTGSDGYKSLDYEKLSAFLIEVCKKQAAEIKEQNSSLRQLDKRYKNLKQEITKLKAISKK